MAKERGARGVGKDSSSVSTRLRSAAVSARVEKGSGAHRPPFGRSAQIFHSASTRPGHGCCLWSLSVFH
ncbi:MAG: hypothetical protein C3F11_19150 [Methylocystaceae bacterium]|nr:MAG: hypothetical protein C3F11_19150 [Methylocystaceae bacterium]